MNRSWCASEGNRLLKLVETTNYVFDYSSKTRLLQVFHRVENTRAQELFHLARISHRLLAKGRPSWHN